MAVQDNVTGIFQSAIVVRSGIIKALQELRDVPTLIDDALASLPQDDLTAKKYGEKTIQQCKDWFLGAELPVRLGLSLTNLKSPIISVELHNGDEEQATLGDVDYTPSEPDPWNPGQGRKLASVHSRESVTVTMMVQGEPEYLLFLSTLVRFALLRRKEDLFDARGFTRSTWNAGIFGAMEDAPGRENFFAHTLRLNGFVRHCYPVPPDAGSESTGYIASTEFGPGLAQAVSNPTHDATSSPQTPTEPPPPGHNPFSEADWADRDVLSGAKQ